jgi:hypothetical protein
MARAANQRPHDDVEADLHPPLIPSAIIEIVIIVEAVIGDAAADRAGTINADAAHSGT